MAEWTNKCEDDQKDRHMSREQMIGWLQEIWQRQYQYNEGTGKIKY